MLVDMLIFTPIFHTLLLILLLIINSQICLIDADVYVTIFIMFDT